MITFVRSHDIAYDSRVQKYISALAVAGIDRTAIHWMRSGKRSEFRSLKLREYLAVSKTGGRWRNALNILRWWLFVFSALWRDHPEVVHACDLDGALPAFIYCRMRGKRLIFDIYDHYAASRQIEGRIGTVVSAIEKRIALMSDLTILADAARLEQHNLEPSEKIMIVENVPALQSADVTQSTSATSGRIKLAYFGILERTHRGIENVVSAVEQSDRFELSIAGLGALSEYCTDAARRCDRIRFLGSLGHSHGMKFLGEADVVLGMYYLSSPNHKYAAPNKYFEHLALGRPLLTTAGTLPGGKVLEHDTGWAIGETRQELADWMIDLSRSNIAEKGGRARQIWDERYAKYYEKVLVKDYTKHVRRFLIREGRAV